MLHFVQQTAAMSARMSEPVIRRPNLPLTAADVAELELVQQSPAHRQALTRLSPNGPDLKQSTGESVLLHAIFTTGLAAIREQAEEEGYAQLAADYQAEESERRAMSRRRPPIWAHES